MADNSSSDNSAVLQSALIATQCDVQCVVPVNPASMLSTQSVAAVVSVYEADNSELLEQKVKSEEDAYKLYNEYAYRIGFGIRRHNYRYIFNTDIVKGREFVCSKEGVKQKKKGGGGKRAYSKMDVRTNCKAKIYFEKDEDGGWVVARHDMEHNHPFADADKVHLLNSHRQVQDDQLKLLLTLVKSGIKVVDAVKFMNAEAGGSPVLGFTEGDAYNAVAVDKASRLNGIDSNTLIEFLRNRQLNEIDFYFDFLLVDNHLCGLFLRDKEMKEDYRLFGKYVGNDGTYRTNKHALVCCPFVGMNHHAQNSMFGVGFLLNENEASYVWLYKTFLKSMDNIYPETFMTDQHAGMAAAIRQVFPNVRHRLCCWHISENATKNIRSLTKKPGFVNLFNFVLMYCDSVAEFESFWKRMLQEYNCSENKWLQNLYLLKKKWCPAYSKKYFSGGALSSQRSETTNKSISANLSKTASLLECHDAICTAISRWRRREKHEDKRCADGLPDMSIPNVAVLDQARRVYTIAAYEMFEEFYVVGLSCNQRVTAVEGNSWTYFVWRPGFELFAHEVRFDMVSHVISCTCQKFTEVAILCCHCLRIYLINGVDKIPDIYIDNRWTKTAKVLDVHADEATVLDANEVTGSRYVESASVWRLSMKRKMFSLICASDSNKVARKVCEDALKKARVDVENEIGKVYISGDEADAVNGDGNMILDPNKSRKKYERNVRKKSIFEKKKNQARTRKHITKIYGQAAAASEEVLKTPIAPLFGIIGASS